MAKNKTVLIIEDDVILAHEWQLRLEKQGYEVFACTNADTGYNACVREWPDAVIIDFFFKDELGQLTGNGGLLFATKIGIYADKHQRRLPFMIGVTASTPSPHFPIQAFSQISKDILPVRLTKPFPPEQLIATLDEGLR